MITVSELLDTFSQQTDYVKRIKANVVKPYFFDVNINDFNANHLRSFLMKRLGEGKKPSTVVKEFQVLKASFKLAGFKTKVFKKYRLKMLMKKEIEE